MRHTAAIMMTVAAGLLLPPAPKAFAAPAGAFNLRVVSDAIPDWSSPSNFVYSALSKWNTDFEKALAQFRWSHRCRRVGSPVHEDSRAVLDPVLFFNSYGVCNCEHISAINCGLWEAWGKPGRLVDLPGHIVSEIFYNHGWHMFDHDSSNYFINKAGQVASATELGASRIHGNVEDLTPDEYYIFDHCPEASAPRGHIFQGPNSCGVIDVAHDWYPGPQHVRPRPAIVGSHAGHRYVLGIRPNERYTRHWDPLGTGVLYARLFANGKDPAGKGSPLHNSRSNGLWVWEPDLSDCNTLFLSQNVKHTREGLMVDEESGPGIAVFHVSAANIVTSVGIQVKAVGSLLFRMSMDGGTSWRVLPTSSPKGVTPQGVKTEIPAGRLQYLLRVDLAPGAELSKLRVETITQVNPRTLPRLRRGRNTVVAVHDEHLESITLQPRLADLGRPGEVLRATGWQVVEKPRHRDPTIRATEEAELVLRATVPRRIRKIRMACTAVMIDPSAELFLAVSYDEGKTWEELRHYFAPGAPYDRRLEVETRKIPRGCRNVLIRYAYNVGGSGLMNVVTEVGYEPAGRFMPYDIMYAWDEYHDGRWVERYHRERVKHAYHRYGINVDGDRPPKMNWVRIEPAGENETGYADKIDVGEKPNPCDYALVYGRNLSQGCRYEVNRPASKAFPDVDRKLLTNGFIGRSSVWKLQKIHFSGPKNEERVGEVVAWEPGENVVVTIDLGKQRTIGGARIAALQPNQKILFPSVMQVEASVDGQAYEIAGLASWEDCFSPPGKDLQWEGWDSSAYDHLPAGGRISYRFPVLFVKRMQARYVRFRLLPMNEKVGMALWQLDVFSSLEKQPWNERIALPMPPD
jgi:hypothetical protein